MFPGVALSAIRFNEHLKIDYERLVAKKQNKKIALIAVARKLLCLMYTLWKKKEMYQTDTIKPERIQPHETSEMFHFYLDFQHSILAVRLSLTAYEEIF